MSAPTPGPVRWLCMKRGGRLVTCGSTSGVSTQMNLMQLFQQQLRMIGSFGCRMENMANAMQKMARGVVHPVIDTQVGFDDIDRGTGAHGGPPGVRQNRSQTGLNTVKLVVTRFVLALRRAKNWLVAQFLFGILALLKLLPARGAMRFTERAARMIGPHTARHKLALYNLKRAFPDKSEAEREAIARDMWGNMALLMAEYIFIDELVDHDLADGDGGYLIVDGVERFLDLRDNRRPFIVFTAHTGNFELLPIIAAKYGSTSQRSSAHPTTPLSQSGCFRRGAATWATSFHRWRVPPGTWPAHWKPAKASASWSIRSFKRARKPGFFGHDVHTNPLLAKLVRHFDCESSRPDPFACRTAASAWK